MGGNRGIPMGAEMQVSTVGKNIEIRRMGAKWGGTSSYVDSGISGFG